MRLPDLVVDSLIRRGAQFEKLPMDRYSIGVARTVEQYESAFRLVHVAYVFQGIEAIRPIDLRITEQHVLREAIVLVAYDGEQLVGTISITRDSPAGLPVDADYPDAVNELRSKGSRLVEIGSFSIVRRCQKDGLAQLLSMAATRVAFRTFDATHVVVGVHPRATPMYRAIWSFAPLGPPRDHAKLRAPVAGHVAERSRVISHFERHFRKPMTSGALPVEHLWMGPPLPCVSMPDDSRRADLSLLQMPRKVFRALFVERSDHLTHLSGRTLAHLRRQRSDETLGLIPSALRKVS